MGRAIVGVSNSLLTMLLRGQWPVEGCAWTDAPVDLTVVGVEHPPAGLGPVWFYAIVESDTFPPNEPGQPLPEIPPFRYRSMAL
jgi:hypothetical protein